MGRRDLAESGVMSDDGERVKSRRERLGMDKKELAEQAGVDRATLTAIEDGKGFRRSSLAKLELALASAEEELGIHVPPVSRPGELIRFEVTLPEGGATVVVSGPVGDISELTEAVRKLTREREDNDA